MINEDQIVPYHTVDLPVEKGPWLIVAPHPDDESFGMGGTLLRASGKGIRCHLVIMTDGALGGAHEDLVAIRREEAAAAARTLGVEPPLFLNHGDRSLKVEESAIREVAELISDLAPAAVFFPAVFELHPDHRATSLLVWKALQSLPKNDHIPVAYEISVQSPVNTLVDITDRMDGKKTALEAYASQLGENNYMDIVTALNRLRTLTLGPETVYAEGFRVYSEEELEMDLVEVTKESVSALFRA